MTMFKHIVVPIDFGEPSMGALDLALELARKFEAKLTLVHTYEIPMYAYSTSGFSAVDLLTPIEDAARQQLGEAFKATKAKWPRTDAVLRRGVAWQEILTAAEEAHADTIVMGTHGRRGIEHALLGSVAEKVVRLSKVPVLTVRSHQGGKS
jgi:nucleotide-binding universal stress UspA family protein